MHDITPTIIPTPPESPAIHEFLAWELADCGLTMRTDARDFEGKWCLAFTTLAWNLTLAALLELAAVQAIRDVEAVRATLHEAFGQ